MAHFINEEAIKKAYDMNKEDRTNIFAEMRKEFKDLLNSVDEENQKKAEAEKAEALKREAINSARVECLNAMIKYFKTLGFCDKELSPEDINELSKYMMEFEEDCSTINNFLSDFPSKMKIARSTEKKPETEKKKNFFGEATNVHFFNDIDDIFDAYFKSL